MAAGRVMLRVMTNTTELEALIARLATIDYSQGSEQATREMAVNPVIGALGWDTFDPTEVAREYSVRGGRVDYCLRWQGRNLVLIEVKKAGTDLTEHQEQLLRYAFDEGVPLAALTDGLAWWLYLPMAGGSWEQRRFSTINFRDVESVEAAAALGRFLDRDASIRGDAQEEAQREFESQERDRRVRAALEDAWLQVLEDEEGLLRDLLAETVEELSGHHPDRETIAQFLRGVARPSSGRADPSGRQSTRSTQPRPSRPTSGGRATRGQRPAVAADEQSFTGRTPAAFWLDGDRHEVTRWKAILQGVCSVLAAQSGGRFGELVADLRGTKRVYFSTRPDDLVEPLAIANSEFFVESHFSANDCVRRAREALKAVRGNDDGFRIELAE